MAEMAQDSLFLDGDNRQSLTVPELAKLSLRSAKVIRKAIEQGRIPGANRDPGLRTRWIIPRDGAEKWWASLERPKKLTTNPNGCYAKR